MLRAVSHSEWGWPKKSLRSLYFAFFQQSFQLCSCRVASLHLRCQSKKTENTAEQSTKRDHITTPINTWRGSLPRSWDPKLYHSLISPIVGKSPAMPRRPPKTCHCWWRRGPPYQRLLLEVKCTRPAITITTRAIQSPAADFYSLPPRQQSYSGMSIYPTVPSHPHMLININNMLEINIHSIGKKI